ncbi:unnamed protein product [Polarella glacialis]|uniref:Uncharacterized protein n=1 Tax=Polarella glacialis TaxID=89957 RepID=A0A813JR57_POLGL|nr:unnamed protein product [Polarella glacialis]
MAETSRHSVVGEPSRQSVVGAPARQSVCGGFPRQSISAQPPKANDAPTGSGAPEDTGKGSLPLKPEKPLTEMTEAERFAYLRRSVKKARLRRKLDDTRKQSRESSLVEAYLQHRQQDAAQAKDERRQNLAQLRLQLHQQASSSSRNCSRSAWTLEDSVSPFGEDSQDVLFDTSCLSRASVQRFESLQSSCALTMTQQSFGSVRVSTPRKPAVPRHLISPSSRPGSQLPSVRLTPQSPAAPMPETQASESLMPRKEVLRREQQALLKKTDVIIYKDQMKEHFQKILNAVEITVGQSAKERIQYMAGETLGKPKLVDISDFQLNIAFQKRRHATLKIARELARASEELNQEIDPFLIPARGEQTPMH